MNTKFKESYETGRDAESLFCSLSKNRNYEVVEITDRRQWTEHIDFILSKDGLSFSVDVKGLKRVNRSDSKFNDNWILLEMRNVHGNKGWIHGKADKIAFLTNDGFIIVDRSNLIPFIREKLTDRTIYPSPKKGKKLYKAYQRSGRKDIFFYITKEDLLSLPHEIWDII